jgi:amidophosphoribosyltransferase
VPGLYRAIGVDYDPETPAFADQCFTGDYPTRLIDHDQNESSKERQLSLLD